MPAVNLSDDEKPEQPSHDHDEEQPPKCSESAMQRDIESELITDLQLLGVSVRQPWESENMSIDGDEKAKTALNSQGSLLSVATNTLRASTASEEMDPEILKLVSFQQHKDLLRACRLSAVMRGGAKIFADPGGTAATYALSEEVQNIDFFISHNWSVSQVKKFLALALCFNLGPAVIAAIVTMVLFAVVGSLGVHLFLQETPVRLDSGEGLVQHGRGNFAFVAPIFVLVAMCGHELARLAGFRGAMVFLDKTCIHQEDNGLKQVGIRKLGAFLRSSSNMVVIYTDVYLSKLWTVYEVACFLSLHPSSKLTVVPTYLPVVIFGGVFFVYAGAVIEAILRSVLGFAYGEYILYLGNALGLGMMMRRAAKAKENIHQRMRLFRVEECICACMEDRPVVFENISVLMRAIGEVDRESSEQDALDAFNILVRRRLPRSLTASIGPLGIGYWQSVALYLCAFLPRSIDFDLLGVLPYPEEWATRYRIVFVLVVASWVLAFFPLMTALMSLIVRSFLHLGRGCEWCFLFAAAIFVLAVGSGINIGIRILAWAAVRGQNANMCLVGLILISIASTWMAVTAFNWGRRFVEEEQDHDCRQSLNRVSQAIDR